MKRLGPGLAAAGIVALRLLREAAPLKRATVAQPLHQVVALRLLREAAPLKLASITRSVWCVVSTLRLLREAAPLKLERLDAPGQLPLLSASLREAAPWKRTAVLRRPPRAALRRTSPPQSSETSNPCSLAFAIASAPVSVSRVPANA